MNLRDEVEGWEKQRYGPEYAETLTNFARFRGCLSPVSGHVSPLPFTAAGIFALHALTFSAFSRRRNSSLSPTPCTKPRTDDMPLKICAHRPPTAGKQRRHRPQAFHFCSAARRQVKFSLIVGLGSGAQEARTLRVSSRSKGVGARFRSRSSVQPLSILLAWPPSDDVILGFGS